MVMAVCLTSCGEGKDEPLVTLSPANAKGVRLCVEDNGSVSKENVNLWINEWSVITNSNESEIDLCGYKEKGFNYYPLDMGTVYELIGEDYGMDVDENTDFSNFYPSPASLIKYIKNNKSKYRYIVRWYGDYILFNRTSSVNYEM